MDLVWLDKHTFLLEGLTFKTSGYGSREEADEVGSFWIMKGPELLHCYAGIIDKIAPVNILEVGVAGGGGAVFLNERYKPSKLVLLDIADTTTSAFKSYIKSARARNVSFFPGIDQADGGRLGEIVRGEFGGQANIDLIIDDASHLYDKTLATFETLFPFLRNRGLYVVEDWGWAHWNSPFWQQEAYPGQPNMSNLIMQLVASSATQPGWVRQVIVNSSMAIIERGEMPIPPLTGISDYYLSRGQNLFMG